MKGKTEHGLPENMVEMFCEYCGRAITFTERTAYFRRLRDQKLGKPLFCVGKKHTDCLQQYKLEKKGRLFCENCKKEIITGRGVSGRNRKRGFRFYCNKSCEREGKVLGRKCGLCGLSLYTEPFYASNGLHAKCKKKYDNDNRVHMVIGERKVAFNIRTCTNKERPLIESLITIKKIKEKTNG